MIANKYVSNIILKRVLCLNLKSRVLNYTSATVCVPKFIHNENNFAHEVLQSLPKYQKTIFTPVVESSTDLLDSKISWKDLTLDELITNFKNFSIHASKNEATMQGDTYTEMCSVLSYNCDKFSDEQLATVLEYMTLWPFLSTVKAQNYYTLWRAVDEACISRTKDWKIDTILKFVDLFFANRLTRQSDFVYQSVVKRARKPDSLSPTQLVQILFYLNIMRNATKGVSMYDLEYCLLKHSDQLTTQELGVAVMGFFKSQKTLHESKLKEILLDRIITEADTIPEITLTCIVKIVRSSMGSKIFHKVPQVLNALENQIDRLSIEACAHVCLLATSSQTYHENYLKKVAQKLVNSITSSRLKDMEKVIYPLAMMNLDPKTSPCIFDSVVQELSKNERLEELKAYPRSLVALLYYLSIRSIFVKPLLEIVLTKTFIKETYGSTNYRIGRDVLFLDSAVELECKDYQGPRLDKKVRNYLSKRYSEYLPNPERKLTHHEKYINDVINTLERIYGKQFFVSKYILPHICRADIVLRFDENKTPLEIPDEYKNIPDFSGFIPSPGPNYLALVISGRNSFATNMNHILLGESVAKLRCLPIMGYNTAMVSYFDWPKEDGLKDEYLRNLISQAEFCKK